MQVTNIRVEKSPDKDDCVRLVCDVSYARERVTEAYWFEVDEQYADILSLRGDPWLVALLPLAATLNEPIKICAPVDRELVSNLAIVQSIWSGWYPWLSDVNFILQETDSRKQPTKRRRATFFSGGVDAYFSLLHAESCGDKIDDLVSINGFDIPLRNAESYETHRRMLEKVASRLDKRLLSVKTNLKETCWRYADWGGLSHGCALAAVAHVLGNAIEHIIISSSHEIHNLIPWGSHPGTDPFLGSSLVQLVHYGHSYTRVEKTEFIADYQEVQHLLHVCYKMASDKNCGKCEKCLRTILTLHYLGKHTGEALPFVENPHSKYCVASKKKMVSSSARVFAKEIADLAESKGKREEADAIRANIRSGISAEKWQRWSPRHVAASVVQGLMRRYPATRRRLRNVRDIFS